MSTITYPALAVATIHDLEPGEWAFARLHPAEATYSLIMKTDEPCTSRDRIDRWVLHIREGSASFVYSSAFREPIAHIEGDIRIPVPISRDQPVAAGEYKPGLLYIGVSSAGLILIAQRDRDGGACAVATSGTGMIFEGLDRIDFWESDRIEYRAPGDSEWHELARIDQPL